MEQQNNSTSQGVDKKVIFPLILIISLFFLWGMANNLNDILISQFKKAFQLSDFQSGLVQSAFYLGYFFLALPASIILRKYNYKTGIIIGLILFAIGAFLFYPAAENASYGFFLFALFVIASGLAFLETAANPFVTVLGSPQTATLRLNLAQAFNPVGCITGILIGQHFIFSGVDHAPETLSQMSQAAIDAYYRTEVKTVEMPYLCIGFVVLAFALLFAITRFPKIEEEKTENEESTRMGLKRLFKVKHFKKAIVAQFFYMGAQVGIWSFLIRYVKHNIDGATDISAANYLTYSLIALTVGRFVGSYLIKYIKPSKLLTGYATINILLIAMAILLPNIIGVWALVATSFFMSIMYPTIFSFGVSGLGKETKLASSILVMAIVGGAILTAVMGQASDLMGITYSYLVPAFCFLIVVSFGISNYKTEKLKA
jgi:FHS family L-fucose permease-like MFS transporter